MSHVRSQVQCALISFGVKLDDSSIGPRKYEAGSTSIAPLYIHFPRLVVVDILGHFLD